MFGFDRSEVERVEIELTIIDPSRKLFTPCFSDFLRHPVGTGKRGWSPNSHAVTTASQTSGLSLAPSQAGDMRSTGLVTPL